ncbi:MAG: EAL domain-containing protein, partial [Moraxellaceae bacterium]
SITINSFESTHRVMVVDDDEIVAKYHAELLRHAGMEVISVSQPLQSLQRAAKFKPDLVILDMHMPEINGIELATLLRQEEEFLVLPIIFVTSDTSESLRESLESLGVNGIMHKPVQIDALVSTCERAINDTIALKNRMARVTQRAAHRQQITRSYFFGAIDNELQTQPVEGQQSNDEHTALYYIGIDTMESLYEQFGQTGIVNLHEQLCTLLSQIIASEEQWTDISNLVVCVLTGHRTHEQHQQRAAQIITQLRSHDYEFSGAKLTLDVSIGITYLDNEHGSANSALLHAEKAYDAARTQGGNRELEYEIEETEIVGGGLDIDFKQGLPAENLSISYQPMISLEEQQIEHYEALVRWKTEAEELIPAAKFLHYIEHSSMRIELDRWVLQTAISAIVNNSNTRETASLFIHLAEETLQQNSFFSFAANVFRSSRLRGDRRLIFMLSEPWVNTQTAQAEIIIKALRDINCGICLTQTGSTSASEHIMNTYQFEYVKLAPRLTTNLEANGETIIELKKITKIAKAAGSKIIATQVEDSKNLSTLWLQGVRLFQGFFIQSPEQEFSTHNDMEFYEAAHKRF